MQILNSTLQHLNWLLAHRTNNFKGLQKQLIQQFESNYKKQNLFYLLTLHRYKVLQIVLKIKKKENNFKLINIASNHLDILNQLNPQYKKYFNNKEDELMNQSEEDFSQLLKKIFLVKDIQDQFKKQSKANKYLIKIRELSNQSKNLYQQISLNLINQSLINLKKQKLCCKNMFFYNQKLKNTNNYNKLTFMSEENIEHLSLMKRSILFLNDNGGLLIYGLSKSYSELLVKGVLIKTIDSQIKKLEKYVNHIYPKDKQPEKQQLQKINFYQYKLKNRIYVQFIPVVDPQLFITKRQNQLGSRFIVKIIIHSGHTKLYHSINKDNFPEIYNENLQALPFEKFYEKLYEYQNIDTEKQQNRKILKFHDRCSIKFSE